MLPEVDFELNSGEPGGELAHQRLVGEPRMIPGDGSIGSHCVPRMGESLRKIMANTIAGAQAA
jgi:hypothetical protein